MKKLVLFMIMAILFLAAVPAFAGSIYKTEPSTDAEKAVAAAFEGFAQNYSKSEVANYLTGDVVYLSPAGVIGMQPKYEGPGVALMIGNGKASRNEFFDLAVKVSDGKAEVTGRHYFTLFGGSWTADVRYSPVWKLRREADGWKLYELDYRNRL